MNQDFSDQEEDSQKELVITIYGTVTGKTELCNRFFKGFFSNLFFSTIYDYFTKDIIIKGEEFALVG